MSKPRPLTLLLLCVAIIMHSKTVYWWYTVLLTLVSSSVLLQMLRLSHENGEQHMQSGRLERERVRVSFVRHRNNMELLTFEAEMNTKNWVARNQTWVAGFSC